MYVSPDFKSKKALQEALERDQDVSIYAPGLGTPKQNGRETIEGPHYPRRHTWYASVDVVNGKIIALDGKKIKVKPTTS